MKRYLLSAALCAALLLTTAAPAMAWTVEKQDLSQIEVTFDPSVDPAKQTNTPSSWAKSEVDAAIAAGLVPTLTGNPKYTDAITREQFAELVVQTVDVIYGGDLFDQSKVSMVHFADYNTEAIQKAASINVVNGMGDGTFAPKVTTNREQIATMIYRAWVHLDVMTHCGVPEADNSYDKFTDRNQVSAWATEGVSALAAAGLMNGTSATTLSPKDSCTVEQSILLLYRLYTKFTGA